MTIARIFAGIGPKPVLEANDPPAPNPSPEPAPQPSPSPAPEPAPGPKPNPEPSPEPKPDWSDDWREKMAGGDKDTQKLLERYTNPVSAAKALKEARALISSGKIKRDMPDPSDKEALAEWRKENGIPDDATGYKLPETVVKRMTDDDKPMLASFTEFAHAKGAPQQVIEIASEWYFDMAEAAAEKTAADDKQAYDDCEATLRKDWVHGEYKANMQLGKRFLDDIPGVGANWAEARLPDGRKLGNVPEFVTWAAEQGRNHFGDAVFANAGAESRHMSRKAEIEKIRDTDFTRYENEGLAEELTAITAKEMARGKR